MERGSQSPVVAVAAKLGITVLELTPAPEQGAGAFELASHHGHARRRRITDGYAEPDDIALVLHTSGTTSRPKIVPLSQRNICTSAANIALHARLTPEDRGLYIMPLFHIHGLMAGCAGPALGRQPRASAPRASTLCGSSPG